MPQRSAVYIAPCFHCPDMKELIALAGVIAILFPFFYLWLHSRRAKEGLEGLLLEGFTPNIVCEFLSDGYKIALDTSAQKIGFVNVNFAVRSKDPLDGRAFETYRLTQIFDYSSIKSIKIHRSLENGSLSKSGIIYVEFVSRSASYSEASMGFTHHDAKAISTLEEAWPKIVKINP